MELTLSKLILGLALALAIVSPASADTLQEIVTKGIVLTAQGNEIDITYTPDGKFSGMEGMLTGTWRIAEEKLCTTSNFDPTERCAEFPKDKVSGDEFEMTSAQGTAKIKIK
jgi:hypothetical protein